MQGIRLAGSADRLRSCHIALGIIGHDAELTLLVNHIIPHQAVTTLKCLILKTFARCRWRQLRASSLGNAIHEQLGLRPRSIHINWCYLALAVGPGPMRNYMKRRTFRIPDAAVKPVTVLRNRGQVNDTEH